MTNSQLKTVKPNHDHVRHFLACLAVITGWRPSSQSTKYPLQPPEAVVERLGEITQKMVKIKEMAIEGVLSTEIDFTTHPCLSPFNAALMRDAYGTGKSSSSGGGPPDDNDGVGYAMFEELEKSFESLWRPAG